MDQIARHFFEFRQILLSDLLYKILSVGSCSFFIYAPILQLLKGVLVSHFSGVSLMLTDFFWFSGCNNKDQVYGNALLIRRVSTDSFASLRISFPFHSYSLNHKSNVEDYEICN